MAQVSDWQTEEAKNTHLDELTLSGEGGLYTNKLMCAVKKKFDAVDGKLDAVAGGLVWRGTKATYADLEAVTSPAIGDMYSVTALGGENYAWDGTAWDSLGTSDANVVHKDGAEIISGSKKFTKKVVAKVEGLQSTSAPETTLSNGLDVADDSENNRGYFDFVFTPGYCSTRTVVKSHDNSEGSCGVYAQVVHASDGNAVQKLFIPSANNTIKLGSSAAKWTEVFAATASINTSDEREKSNIEKISDDLIDAWENVDYVQFKFNSSIEKKGAGNARTHCGLIAQRINSAFKSKGLDTQTLALFCYDKWEAREELRDENGEVVMDAVQAGDAYGLRYEEALCLEAAYQRRRADRLEARIAALEARLGVN